MNKVAVLWPDAANYARFVEVCDDRIKHATVDEYHASAGAKLEQLARQGVAVQRIDFDPDELLRWAIAGRRRVDSQARAEYAAILAGRERAKHLN